MPNSTSTRLPGSFVRVGWSSVLVQSSEQIALAAAPLAAVLILAASPSETALLQLAQTAPFLLCAIPIGVLVDRVSRKAVLIGSEALRAVTLAVLVLLITAETLDYTWLLVLGLVGAIGTVGFSVSAPAVVPLLVSRDRLTDANRWLELGRSAAFIGGPAAAGALVSLSGAPAAFAVGTVICVIALTLLVRLDVPPVPSAPRRHILRDLRESAAFAARSDVLRPIIVTAIVFNTGWFVIQAVFVVYAIEHLSMDAATVGLTLGGYGVGMVTGALIARRVATWLSIGRMTLLGPIGGFAAALALAATLVAPSPLLAGAAFFLFGVGPVIWAITTTSLRQAITPFEMLGQVSSLLVMATYGARPIGAGLAALVAARWGVAACLVIATVIFAAQLVYVSCSALPRLTELPPAPVSGHTQA
ncbi:MFS transporter [Agromyces silvae]|uniref:MFS transporter n=1 Tax=Agromyces silvae TaxID=3388266 RepID=UPI00280A90CA|nr:MFS transporter [Agromyces protaetiae]